jgi:hypothetical protein
VETLRYRVEFGTGCGLFPAFAYTHVSSLSASNIIRLYLALLNGLVPNIEQNSMPNNWQRCDLHFVTFRAKEENT